MTVFFIIFGSIVSLLFLIVLIWAVCCGTIRKEHPDSAFFRKTLYAHRGLHDAEKPENSLPAFIAAKNNGYGMEFDLHLTLDGQLIVMHDSSLLRTCGVDLKIPEHTLEELRRHPLKDGSVIPTFKELLKEIGGAVPLLIELKNDGNNGKALVEKTLEELRGYPGKYCIESFDPRVLKWLKKSAPEVYRGQLSCNFFHGTTAPLHMKILLFLMVLNISAKPDFIAYNIEDQNAIPLKWGRLCGADLFFWTVRRPEQLSECVKNGNGCIFEGFDPKKNG